MIRSFVTGLVLLPVFAFAQISNFEIYTGAAEGREYRNPSVAINQKNPDNMILATGGNHVFVTSDQGATWKQSPIEIPGIADVSPLVTGDRKGKFYFVSTSSQDSGPDRIFFYESKDNGATWSELGFVASNASITSKNMYLDEKGNIYLGWTTLEQTSTECKGVAYFSESSNGKKWSDPMIINTREGDCGADDFPLDSSPVVVFDKYFAAYTLGNSSFMDRSYNNGKTWLRNDIKITESSTGWEVAVDGVELQRLSPVILGDKSETSIKGTIHMLWTEMSKGKGNTDIWYINSNNGGDFWSSRVRVNNDEGTTDQFLGTMAQDQVSGFLYSIYYSRPNSDSNEIEVYVAFSKNGGRTFKNVKISESPFKTNADVYLGEKLHLAAHDGSVVSVWPVVEGDSLKLMGAVFEQAELDDMLSEK